MSVRLSPMKDSIPSVHLLAPREAAKLLSVSPRTLWKWTFEAEPALPHIRLGRLVRYRPADLETWINRQRQGGGQ